MFFKNLLKSFFSHKVLTLGLFVGSFMGTAFADVPSTHGMLLFGDKTIYASHLPMFHNPHNYQVVYSLTMENLDGADTLAKYKEVKESWNGYFTIVPERMDLTKLMDGTITEFQSLLFQGHFERGGTNLGPVKVKVGQFLINVPLEPNQETATHEKYVVFGEKDAYYGVHVIGKRPNFDSIVEVSPNSSAIQVESQAQFDDSLLPLTLTSTKPSVPGVQTVPSVSDVFENEDGVSFKVEKVIYEEIRELQ